MMKNSTQSSETKPTYCAHLGHNFLVARRRIALYSEIYALGNLRAENIKFAGVTKPTRKA